MRPRIYLLFKLQLNASIPVVIFQTQTLSTCIAAVVLSSAGHILKRKAAMPINAKCRTPSVTSPTVPTPGWSEPLLVDVKSTTMSRLPSVSTTEDNFVLRVM
jgi:hypothetical protein